MPHQSHVRSNPKAKNLPNSRILLEMHRIYIRLRLHIPTHTRLRIFHYAVYSAQYTQEGRVERESEGCAQRL